MKSTPATLSIAMAALLAFAAPAFAHHGTSAYDQTKRVTLKGTVAEFEWANPHSQIHLDVKDEKGTVVHWNFEAQPPNILARAGWTRNSLKAGDEITIVGSPARNGTPIGIIQKVVLANGQELTATPK
jgi:hypothetical protein